MIRPSSKRRAEPAVALATPTRTAPTSRLAVSADHWGTDGAACAAARRGDWCVRLASFTPTRRAVVQARAMVRRFVADMWGQGSSGLADDAAAVASELAANAVLHGGTDTEGFRIRLVRREECLRIEVFDTSPWLPQAREPDALAESGRGLLLIAAVSHRWGVTCEGARDNAGKAVWAELGTPTSVAPRMLDIAER